MFSVFSFVVIRHVRATACVEGAGISHQHPTGGDTPATRLPYICHTHTGTWSQTKPHRKMFCQVVTNYNYKDLYYNSVPMVLKDVTKEMHPAWGKTMNLKEKNYPKTRRNIIFNQTIIKPT